MADYVIAFDLSPKKMKNDGLESSVTKVYADLGRFLRSCGFSERIQGSTYRTTNNDGINSLCEALDRKLEIPLFCAYADKIHFLRCDEYSDITERFRINQED
jgi:virulence-associated protein VapD